jgi:hypothetical protein
MARPLQIATTLGMSKRFEQNGITYIYHGQKYRVKMINYKGYQFSPFYDRTNTSTDATIENLTNGKTLTYSPLVPHMIERYGFYEGKGLRYRVEPSAVLEVFPYLKGKK